MLPPSPRHIEAVYEVGLSAAAAFVVMVCGDIMTMPSLPKASAANSIDIATMGRPRATLTPQPYCCLSSSALTLDNVSDE
jgi:hypothetical protein